MARPRSFGMWVAAGVLAAGACGGDAPEPAGTPADTAAPATDPAVASPQDTAVQATSGTELMREAFAYRGSGRDPFLSLVQSGDVRPMPQDLRVRAINFDPRYPQRSVVTLQDTTMDRRYNLRVGDQVGRIRIAQIRETEIVITIEEFGTERQEILPIRRRQEDNTP